MTTITNHAPTLAALSKALQSLHHSLLEHQAYTSGFTGSPFDLFDRATKDSDFTWLKPLREAIVTLDERRADDTSVDPQEANAIANWISDLVNAESGPMRDKTNAAFQSDANAILAAKAARNALSNLRAG